jgi:hypothetical protein
MAAGGGPGGGGGGGGGGGVTQSVKDATGSTTAAYVTVFTHTNTKGVIGIGSIENQSGSNGINVRETAIDKFGNTVAQVTALAPGNTYLLNPQTMFEDTALPYFTSYQVEVEDESSGNHAAYELHYSGIGTVS